MYMDKHPMTSPVALCRTHQSGQSPKFPTIFRVPVLAYDEMNEFFFLSLECGGLAGFEFVYPISVFFSLLFSNFSCMLRLWEKKEKLKSERMTTTTCIAGY